MLPYRGFTWDIPILIFAHVLFSGPMPAQGMWSVCDFGLCDSSVVVLSVSLFVPRFLMDGSLLLPQKVARTWRFAGQLENPFYSILIQDVTFSRFPSVDACIRFKLWASRGG